MAEHKNHNTAAGIVGAVVGAGVAIAATKVLSDKKNRKAVVDTVTGVKNRVVNSVSDNVVDPVKKQVSKELYGEKKKSEKKSMS